MPVNSFETYPMSWKPAWSKERPLYQSLAKRLEDQQRSRDPQLQVVTNKAIELKGHKMQQLDSIISAKGQTAYSSVILGNVGNQLLTMQITLPADDQQKAQTTAENIINTLVIQ